MNGKQLVVVVVGLLLAVAGLVVGLQPHHESDVAVSCGSAFAPVSFPAAVAPLPVQQPPPNANGVKIFNFASGTGGSPGSGDCGVVLGSPRVLAIALIGLGVVVMAVGTPLFRDKKPAGGSPAGAVADAHP